MKSDMDAQLITMLEGPAGFRVAEATGAPGAAA